METEFVKTADLDGRRPLRNPFGNGGQWAFCERCYGREMKDGLTREKSGAVCSACDGTGTVWRVTKP